MEPLLIVYGTHEGHCAKIASFMAEEADKLGWPSLVLDGGGLGASWHPAQLDSPVGAVALVASIHQGKHPKALSRFVTAQRGWLETLPTLFASVSLSAADPADEPQQAARGCLEAFLSETGWQPTLQATVAGALLYREYNFLVRWMMRRIAAQHGNDTDTSRNYEYTDWRQVASLVDALHEHALHHESVNTRAATPVS